MTWYSTVTAYITKLTAANYNAMVTYIRAHATEHATGGIDPLTAADIGAGDVTGAASSTDNAIVRFNGTGGKTIQNSGIVIDDSNNIQLAKGLEIERVLTADHTYSGITATFNAHENTTIFQVGYFDSSGQIALADSDTSAAMPVVAMATAAISTDISGLYLLEGVVRDDSWNWSEGGKIYASGTAGGLTQTVPTGTGKVVQILGYAITPVIMYFKPDDTYLELA